MPTVVCSTRALYPKDDININGVPMHGLRVFDNALPLYNYAWNLFEAIRRRI